MLPLSQNFCSTKIKSLCTNFDKMNHFNIGSVKMTLNIASQSSEIVLCQCQTVSNSVKMTLNIASQSS